MEKSAMADLDQISADAELDTFGMLCPMPIFATSKKMRELSSGQILKVLADDEGICKDLPAWCRQTGNECLGVTDVDGDFVGFVRKA